MSVDLMSPRTNTVRSAPSRQLGAFTSPQHRRRYLLILGGLIVCALALTVLMLSWGNSQVPFSEKWWRVSGMRADTLIVIAVVTLCQSFATAAFQTATNNRILTPSIMGFESLYVLIQTSVVFFFGVSGLAEINGFVQFLVQVAAMVLFAVMLYSWLFSGRLGNLHIMLLVGIIIGTGLGTLATSCSGCWIRTSSTCSALGCSATSATPTPSICGSSSRSSCWSHSASGFSPAD